MDKNSKIEKSYDELTYKSAAFAQSSPYKLEACATLLGINPPPCKNAKVLEIGCSFGGNLIPFAVNNENARVVGIDLSGEQIRRGKEIVKEISLSNLELIHGDICEFKSDEKFDYIIAHGVFSWVPDFVKDAILRVVRENLSQNGVAFISYNVYPGWKIKDVVRDLMLLAAKDKDSTEERLKAAKEALLIFKEILLAKDNEIYEKQIPLKVLLFWIDNILSKSDFYVAHEFLEEINDPFYFKDFNAMLVKNELAYLCECGLEDILAPNIGMELADSYKDKKFKDRIDLEQFIDIVSNRVFRQSLIVHAKAYESVANKQIGPSDVNKIHIVDDFIKKDDGWHDKFALMPQDISWLCEVFYKMYPASINLSQILEILPEDKLAVYSAFVRLLTNSADAMIVKDELKDIEYAPNHSRLKTNLTGYIKYFLNHKDNTDIIFANKFGLAEQLSMLDYYIFLLLDGKNTLEEITAKSLKFIKENSIKISDKNGKELKNDRLVAHIKSYVIGTAKIASMLYLLEEI
ncbi:class I SAM-dependent methyltransferase [Campylobacter concisus]|uniref:Methyltransferase domain-containing protein n=1 Tax=Campylobacter concisus TaxID=199 RepID=A0A7S9SC34_9BACT|nr:class I SAM-dependent methyltransferase [Campylobacter concisus]QPI07385.1 methyltransferase domain-containing protein [Campylobacter concisus]